MTSKKICEPRNARKARNIEFVIAAIFVLIRVFRGQFDPSSNRVR